MHGGTIAMTGTKLFNISDYLRKLERDMTARAAAMVEPALIPASFPLGRAWFVVCVEGRHEVEVSGEIERMGFGVFCPMETKTKIRRRRRVDVREAVFPNYLFTAFDREREDWGLITSVDGVIGLITNGNMPVRVPDVVIDRLRNADAAGVFDAANKLNAGERVEIMEGPFATLFARVKSASKKDRMRIVLDSFGEMDIDPCFLRKVE
jgi:transcriptional antiterminator RfaH